MTKAQDKQAQALKPQAGKSGGTDKPERAKLELVGKARDAALAKQALAAHSRGERLPQGKALEKAIKAGQLQPTKDSAGRAYYTDKKTSATLAKSLNQPPPRETTSRNLQHAGLTSTKYKEIDRKLLGVKLGTLVIKSGGTLRTEAAGNALHGAAKSDTAKALTKPLDAVLRKAESWHKAGAVESIGAKLQMKLEAAAQQRAAIKELKAVVKEGTPQPTQPKEADKGRALEERARSAAEKKAPEHAQGKEKTTDRGPDHGHGRDR